MIRWRLNQLMAQKRISGKDLARALETHPNTIYRLRRTDEMPMLDGERLNNLCLVLGCVPTDLIDYVPDSNTSGAYLAVGGVEIED